ncbi:hypothetical protein BDR05DRAFT_1000504 [Suillus weaverae]|nr:hypothetical protein BDR05DRAFT_1000504 [Suillus weaverae]
MSCIPQSSTGRPSPHLKTFWPLIISPRPSDCSLYHIPDTSRTSVLASRVQILSQPCRDDAAYPSILAFEILSLDLSSSVCKVIIPALPTSAPRLKTLEIKGNLFMSDKTPSEIELLLGKMPPKF